MMTWFERDLAALPQLEQTLSQCYPTMHAIVSDGVVTVKGTFPVVHDGHEIDRYKLSIALPDDYPQSMPSVWETGERIPRIADRHVFPKSGALCLGVPAALWIALDGNFTIDRVLEIPVRNYLIGNSMVEAGDKWPYGECAHGADGMLEFFQDTIGTSNPMTVAMLLNDLFKGKVKGHWPCPCGSGAIIRKCHADAIGRLRVVPQEILAQSGLMILDLIKTERAERAE